MSGVARAVDVPIVGASAQARPVRAAVPRPHLSDGAPVPGDHAVQDGAAGL